MSEYCNETIPVSRAVRYEIFPMSNDKHRRGISSYCIAVSSDDYKVLAVIERYFIFIAKG